jgi:hypothetical protein
VSRDRKRKVIIVTSELSQSAAWARVLPARLQAAAGVGCWQPNTSGDCSALAGRQISDKPVLRDCVCRRQLEVGRSENRGACYQGGVPATIRPATLVRDALANACGMPLSKRAKLPVVSRCSSSPSLRRTSPNCT